MKTLVVDDEPSIPRLFRQRFRKEIREGKMELLFASSAEEAIGILQTSKADIVMILSDINMPGMSGLELLEEIRRRDQSVPVYMISAYENEEYSKLSQEKGANGFIPKPLDFESIRDLISRDQ